MTTATAFYASLYGLSLSGVTNLATPPIGAPAVIPCMWIDSVSMENGPEPRGQVGGTRVLRARVVVLVEANAQDTHANRWTNTVAMADTLDVALAGMTNPIGGPLKWAIVASPNFNGYFAVTADCEGQEWV